MEENFEPVAQTRANYYTPGSPVQFVCVELLKGSVSGEHAVCLTFKNISRVTLTALEIHFKCKGADGVILCEDNFEYRGLNVQPGESVRKLPGQQEALRGQLQGIVHPGVGGAGGGQHPSQGGNLRRQTAAHVRVAGGAAQQRGQ